MDTKRNLTCPTCYKDYKRKSFYNRHIIVCEMLKEKSYDDEEIQDLPSTYELYTMVKEIALKYNECKNECTHLKTRLNLLEKKYKKVEILPEEYLLQNKQCDNSYDEWLKTISIKKENVHNILHEELNVSICKIVEDNHNYSTPLCAFKHNNKNVIMIYNGKYWDHINHKNTSLMIDKIVNSILSKLNQYDLDSDSLCRVVTKLTGKEYNENAYIDYNYKLFNHIHQVIHF